MKKSINNNHKFHIVNPSPWPMATAFSIASLAYAMVIWLNSYCDKLPIIISMFSLTLCLTQWWRDVIRETTTQGCHTKDVQKGIVSGMILFILSEVMFFASIFWALFHLSSFPSLESGSNWPPLGINLFNPLGLPLLNTLILITSGLFLSWSHYSIFKKNFKMAKVTLMITITMGMTFSMIQLYEYHSAAFTMMDSIYGSLFFFSTGFHGMHVAVGTVMLMISLKLMEKNQFSPKHMTFFNFTSWYWHFVDIVWICLYIFLYWWPWK